VIQVTDEAGSAVFARNRVGLLVFYSPKCPHCHAFVPKFAEAAAQLAADGDAVAMMAVDVMEETTLASAFHVRSYPALFWKSDEAWHEFAREWTSAGDLVAEVRKHLAGSASLSAPVPVGNFTLPQRFLRPTAPKSSTQQKRAGDHPRGTAFAPRQTRPAFRKKARQYL
jgi:thiol-disulfide isomerase/thioredoxin